MTRGALFRRIFYVSIVVFCAASFWFGVIPKHVTSTDMPISYPDSLKRALTYTPPINASSTVDVVRLLKYYYDLSNQKEIKILIGQQLGHANEGSAALTLAYASYFTDLEKQTGKLPAIMGMDYGWEQMPDDYSNVNKLLIEHWKQGGVVTISMSPRNPFTGGGLRDLKIGNHQYDEIVTLGTEVNKRWEADLDKVAVGLSQLQDAGVVVLWRPLHEMNGDFFWWSFGKTGRVTQNEYKKLWIYMFNYFTKEKKLNNLLWVYSPNAALWENGVKDTDYYYPGTNYVDIVGMDYYEDGMIQFNNHGNYDKLIALGKPFGLSEVGPQSRSGFDNLMVLNTLRASYPQTIYEMYWTGWTNLGYLHTKRAIIENDNAKKLMNDTDIITLDKRVTEFGNR